MKPTRKLKTGLFAAAFGIVSMFGSAVNAQTGTMIPQATNAVSPIQVTKASTAPVADSLSKNQELLLKARHALMSRDVASAERFVKEAQALNVNYREADDRPDYVIPLITKYREIEQAAKTGGTTEAVKRELAKNYLHQAEALRRCRDFDSAESLVMEAKAMNVVLDAQTVQSGMDVATVLQRIRDDRLALQTMQSKTGTANAQAPLKNLSEGTKRKVAEVQQQLQVARQLMSVGQLERAEEIGKQLQKVSLPESAYMGNDSPTKLLGDIAVKRSGQQVQKGSIVPVQAVQFQPAKTGQSNGYLYVKEADAALRSGNRDAALKNYQDALRYESEMDANMIKHIHDSIANLKNPAPAAPVAKTEINFNQPPQNVQSEIRAYILKTNQLRQQKPEEALAMLQKAREELNASALDASIKTHFNYSLDLAIADTKAFIAEHGPMIALDQRNKDVEEQIRAKREKELQTQNQLAEDTEKFNQLLEEGKFDEAIILAKRCQDYSQNSVVSLQMYRMAQSKKQAVFNEQLKDDKSNGWLQAMNDVERSAVINVSDDKPLDFGPIWNRVKNRTALDTGSARSEEDREILEKLNMKITLPFDQPMPLSTVMDFIRTSMEMNLLVDAPALAEAGVTTDMLIETKLSNITLKNYLKHILEPYGLTYVVDSEALKITGKNRRSGRVRTVNYQVADLVTPIPNFNGFTHPMGMENQFQKSYNQVARRGMTKSSANTIEGLANDMSSNSMVNPNVLAQIAPTPDGNGLMAGNAAPGAAGGSGDLMDELIDLITTVIGTDEEWEEYGRPHPFNLTKSLSIRQTEENHEQTAALLEKLRSMLDLQISVEVRFITISDEYTEKIGVNFNASIATDAPSTENSNDNNNNSNGGNSNNNNSNNNNSNNSNGNSNSSFREPDGNGIFGYTGSTTSPFTSNLNLEFSQNSYGFAIPQFGNYDPTVGAQFGFAILSDIETYFFMNAAESDRRSNILQAPKITLMDGQSASLQDMIQQPYIMTVIPVVGEFAVAQMPVVTILNEGQVMTVQAAASLDRRFVRMTLMPYFSTITDPNRTFKFDGSDTASSSSTTASKGSDSASSITDERESNSSVEYVRTGTTVQQPIISTFAIMTSVKVPDGGTVLLGGIKRLSEGRNEGGVPILSKIPYLKRLFTNSAIGRETTSLMMMVTPRIIIQQEEEEFVMGPGNNT